MDWILYHLIITFIICSHTLPHTSPLHLQICDAFNANRYPFPDDLTRQRQMHAEVTSRLRELHTTNEAGERRREAVINSIAQGLEGWTTLVRREKAVYHTMNKLSLDVTSKV